MKYEYQIAVEASVAAGNSIMKIYDKDFHIDYKKDDSPLTEADQAANSIIMSYLEKTGVPIISEENKQISYEERKKWTSCWIVDPLDGTKEFIKKNGEFTVNIALVINGLVEFGVIYVPATKTLYYGDVSKKCSYKKTLEKHFLGAKLLSEIKSAEKIKPKSLKDKIRVVGSRSHMSDETVLFMNDLKENSDKHIEVVSKGSSLKFCLVAEGKADIYPRFAPTMEWDTAAGQAICKASGVEVISLETNKPMLYNKENLLNSWFKVLVK
ncbi:3'(2'),5'-bisphosphate nucleotidase CysQ [Lutibacter sp. B1]|uniref:3'(2'),5'-bisphosphate nucleotidase CysQ n=1 Tax=Lutibacter sp. B1 TaxID=2725996 RepID=UPI001456E561|nr:3'(2'),5'-bisphosphate nucleotidase CysQ [Lutibacter sp. B1]NLP59241.1 3'(2'),5'-bisphosphate nucleotidase CysQ [Lutibacter sp. B1]